MEQGQNPAAGWYVDSRDPGRWRWWDGESWTEQYAPRGRGGQWDDDPRNDSLATWGYLAAILLPLFGVVIGVALMARSDRRGGNVLILAVVAFVAWYLLLEAEAL